MLLRLGDHPTRDGVGTSRLHWMRRYHHFHPAGLRDARGAGGRRALPCPLATGAVGQGRRDLWASSSAS